MRHVIRLLMLLLAVAAAPPAAIAEEAITRFVSDLTVNPDASIRVSETITLTAEGNQIRRGILRDIPTIYQTPDGERYEVGLSVEKVRRNGKDEPWATESIANGIRIRIGQADALLEHGPQTYEITYAATGELGFFDSYDEIYWNVTGNAWTFAIDEAQSVIRLPPGAAVIQHAGYTGAQGARGQDFKVETADGNLFRAVTTRRLAANEGFTVAVGFTKGIVTPPPPPPDTTVESYYVLGGGVGLMLIYYVAAWLLVGRDPAGRPVIPLFHPPEDLGPADVRFIWKRVFDQKSYAAAIIGLAAKGLLTIKGGKPYELARRKGDASALTSSETELYRRVPQTVEVARSNAGALALMRSTLETAVETSLDRSTFRKNRLWFWIGLVLSVLILGLSLAVVRPLEFTSALMIVFIGGALWAAIVWMELRWFRIFARPGIGMKVLAIICFLVTLPIVWLGFFLPQTVAQGLINQTLMIYIAAMAALVAMHAVFFKLLAAFTDKGAKLRNDVQGLRLYMATAEEKRLNALNPPEKTPQLFERLLPFALALDCENEWSEKFAAVLAAASYVAPSWYQGRSWSAGDIGSFTDQLDNSRYQPSTSSSSFSTSSSSWSPGSSSGSSGGGSSGGGGGGGGGSGW